MKIRYIFIIFNFILFSLNSYPAASPDANVYIFSIPHPGAVNLEKVKVIEKDGKLSCLYLVDETLYMIYPGGVHTTISDVPGWFLTDGIDVYHLSGRGASLLKTGGFHTLNLSEKKEQRLFIPGESVWNDFFLLSGNKKFFLIPDQDFRHILFQIDGEQIKRVYEIDLQSRFLQPMLQTYTVPNGLVQGEEFFPVSRHDQFSLFVLSRKLYLKPLYFYDLNKDGKKDILIQDKNGISVYLNNGQDQFPGKFSYLIDKLLLSEDTQILDVNGDGYHDLVTINKDKIDYRLQVRWGDKQGDLGNAENFAVSKQTLKKIIPFSYGFFDVDNDGKYEFIHAKYEIKDMSPTGFVKKLIEEGVHLQFVVYNIDKKGISFRLSYSIFIEFQPFQFFFIENLDSDNRIEICIIKRKAIEIYKIISRGRYSKLQPIKIPEIDGYFLQKINHRYYLVGRVKNTNKVLAVLLSFLPAD